MTRLRSILALALAGALTSGCAVEPKTDLGDAVPGGGDDKADFFSRNVDVASTINHGDTVRGEYATRGFTGYTFAGARGARVAIDLVGDGNDPVLYLYGPMIVEGWGRARRVARNDDSGAGFDSHLDVRLPADGTYLILAREYYGDGGEFTLSLGCDGDSCRPECRGSSCPTGSSCNRIYCIRAPCPSFCNPDPVVTGCGGIQGLRCDEGQFCDYAPEAQCGAADQLGACRPQPTACTREFNPVCGCDGHDYSNPCTARAAGASVAYEGACGPAGQCLETECGPRPAAPQVLCDDGVTTAGPGECVRDESGACGWEMIECPAAPACGSRGLDACPDGQFCNFSERADCGRADAPGTCAPTPDFCTRDFQPVCGCDGRTYANACGARAAGVSVDHDGECQVGCRIAGCSGQLCIPEDSDGGITTCDWQSHYACYRGETCERQTDGSCGWTSTPTLDQCLAEN